MWHDVQLRKSHAIWARQHEDGKPLRTESGLPFVDSLFQPGTLLVAERDHRIKSGGAAGREIARQHGGQQQGERDKAQ